MERDAHLSDNRIFPSELGCAMLEMSALFTRPVLSPHVGQASDLRVIFVTERQPLGGSLRFPGAGLVFC